MATNDPTRPAAPATRKVYTVKRKLQIGDKIYGPDEKDGGEAELTDDEVKSLMGSDVISRAPTEAQKKAQAEARAQREAAEKAGKQPNT